jgi:hypothetical protein
MTSKIKINIHPIMSQLFVRRFNKQVLRKYSNFEILELDVISKFKENSKQIEEIQKLGKSFFIHF